ncbi:MAG: hypothetical protein J2P13_03545 [Acidobacteria bacterium]|nr:hypothetical protein [Acidobacteriota bacterium]
MYTETLIDDLVATVECSETSVRVQAEQPNSETWFAVAPAELAALAAAQLRGVR